MHIRIGLNLSRPSQCGYPILPRPILARPILARPILARRSCLAFGRHPSLYKTNKTNFSTSPIMSHIDPPLVADPAPEQYKLVFYAPNTHLDQCKDAVFDTGAGTFPDGKYSRCCFQSNGLGQFLPSETANPHLGMMGQLETAVETKVEILCVNRETVQRAVRALVEAHPYETPAWEVYKMEDIRI